MSAGVAPPPTIQHIRAGYTPPPGMSLRAKVLALFGAFAVVPLLAIGVVDYVRSTRAVDTLVLGQTALIADRVAAELADRYATTVQPFFTDVWTAIGPDFDWISIRDESGAGSHREAYRLGPTTPDDAPRAGSFVVADSSAAASRRPRSVVAARSTAWTAWCTGCCSLDVRARRREEA